MVDVIRFYIENVELTEKALKKFDIYPVGYGKERGYYKKMKREIENDLDKPKGREFDYFSIVYDKKEDENIGKLWFEQNIRRTYFDRIRTDESDLEIAMSDLHYNDFVREIEYWANELDIDEEDFWKAKITKIELGVTLHFKTPMNGIISCFGSLKNLPRKHVYENSGVKFIGNNYQVSIYDKLDRAFHTGEIFEKQPAKRRNILNVGAKKVKAYIRYEIKITTVSGVLPKDFGDISTLDKLNKSWNNLNNMLLNKIDDFTFVDILSPEIVKYIIYEQIGNAIDGVKGKDKTPIEEYLVAP
ncbi:hypothetical protein VUJ46_19020 [Chryseobacterium sp. MYb264]|uniref:hypothetical protein n=1 Tax=Chryseobacterium sp. MYb264 TaxID=2745153 RepID=UPI002E13FDB3|nr:hypothetical protein VUJ46_19020 [Chryseobacterium sp. MYb264]